MTAERDAVRDALQRENDHLWERLGEAQEEIAALRLWICAGRAGRGDPLRITPDIERLPTIPTQRTPRETRARRPDLPHARR